MKTTLAALAAFLKIKYFPDASLLSWLFILVLLDLITGIFKSYVLNEARTSSRYRRTGVKLGTYLAIILACFAASNVVALAGNADTTLLDYCNQGVIIYFLFIELTSVFENIYKANPNSKASQAIKPILNILTFKLKNNPATKLPDQEDDRTKKQ